MAQVRQKHYSAEAVLSSQISRTRRKFRLLIFKVSRKVYSAWNTIRTEKCIDDAELATFLIDFYEKNQKTELCSQCSSSLEQVCPKCFYEHQKCPNKLFPVITLKIENEDAGQKIPSPRMLSNKESGQLALLQKDIAQHPQPSTVSLDDDAECPESFADMEDFDSTYVRHDDNLIMISQPNGQEKGGVNKLPKIDIATGGERFLLDQFKTAAGSAQKGATCSNNDTVETQLQPDIQSFSTGIEDAIDVDHQTTDIQSPADDIFTAAAGDFINEKNGVSSSQKAFKHSCRVCGRQFCSLSRLAAHAQRHDISEGIPFWCDGCQQGFLTMPDFTGHLCVHTQNNELVLKTEKCQTPDHPHSSEQLSEEQDNRQPVSEPLILQTESLDTQFELIDAENPESRHDKIPVYSRSDVSQDNLCGKDQEPMVQDMQVQSPTAPNTWKIPGSKFPLKKLDRPFKCTHCSQSYRFASGLTKHSQKHTGERAFPCPQCDAAFRSLSSRRKHQEKEHWRTGPITCQACKKQFKSQMALDLHLPLHNEKLSFQCNACQKLFKTESKLRYHTRRDHRYFANYRCGYCEKVFCNKYTFDSHLAAHTDLKALLCSHCGEAFPTKQSFERHAVKHGAKKFVCEECGKGFYEKGDYKKHKRIHVEVRPFPCPHDSCSLRFLTENLSRKHYERVHLRLRPHKCQTCGKAYPCTYTLNEHIRSQHTLERPFKCPHCPKTFAKSDCRKQHLKTHKRDKAQR